MLFSNLALALLPISAYAASPEVYAKSRSRARNVNVESVEARDETNQLEKRSFSGRATFYDVGLGACGWTNVASDYIVALNSAQYGSGYPGPHCGASITISYGGTQVTATIADECPTCDYGGLDLSRDLFTRFASESTGVFYMDWWYNDGSSSSPSTTTTAEASTQQPTSTYVAPTTTSTTETPTSTYVAPSTTSTSSSTQAATSTVAESEAAYSSSSAAASASAYSASASLTSAVVSGSVTVSGSVVSNTASASASASAVAKAGVASSNAYLSGNLAMFNEAVVHLGRIAVKGNTKA